MAKYKLKKGQKIGGLAAETDPLLEAAFVDTGYLSQLINTTDPKFLILGRTGSGKTALIKQISKKQLNIKNIHPDSLSMHYLHNNQIFKILSSWGLHFDIFYKYLWKHIFILELIKLRYEGKKGSQSLKQIITNILYSSKRKTKENALNYLEKYGDEFWILSDTHVKSFTHEFEKKLENDVGIKITADKIIQGNFEYTFQNVANSKQKIETETISRVQKVINDYQISDLDSVIDNLIADSFIDDQKKYYLLVDDLDISWMPDDLIYLDLIKSLFHIVKELNYKFNNVKIIVALRTNIFFRIFNKPNITEPQFEKWYDVLLDIKWNKDELETMLNFRLSEIFKEKYTNITPTINDILPKPKRKIEEQAFDYILNRTFYRPRDILDFFNKIIDIEGNLDIKWTKIETAEFEYSKSRLDSVLDEWKASFNGIQCFFPALTKLGPNFCFNDFNDYIIEDVLTKPYNEDYHWLHNIVSITDEKQLPGIRFKILNGLFLMGIIGIKNEQDHRIRFSFDQNISQKSITLDNINDYTFCIHNMFKKALNLY